MDQHARGLEEIDASFIRTVNENPQAATIVRAVLGLGRGLDMPVLAEGVETAGELAFLNAEACAEVQGYFLGRPQPIEHFRNITGSLSCSQPGSSTASSKRRSSAL
ncbi:MAG: EAL domain-containing protein [Hyphomicrobium zavarzinii]|uniref:EAL domain-containing protein n=1 Tax=Hyphomicrobium zavarzinii TaxID=48292 RepID=UPI001A483F31|nr:EAL domain-containing protein [Hyphomicrobium zavarzinii]